jgi:hypothetical protein
MIIGHPVQIKDIVKPKKIKAIRVPRIHPKPKNEYVYKIMRCTRGQGFCGDCGTIKSRFRIRTKFVWPWNDNNRNRMEGKS